MARNFDELSKSVTAVVAQEGADKAALAQAQADLAAAQGDAAKDQATIDGLTAQLNSLLPAAATPST